MRLACGAPDRLDADIDIVPVCDRGGLDAFIAVAFALNNDDPNWVPPLRKERHAALSPHHNPYFRHAQAQFWIARRGGRAVGRISAQIDRISLERHRDAAGHFGCLEAVDDPAVVGALAGTAEAWLRAHGMRRVLGPFNLSINEECGLLVDGFDTPPMLMMGHAKPHLARHLASSGYTKAKDLHAYIYDIRSELPPSARALVDRAKHDRIALRPLRRMDFAHEVAVALDIFNDAWSGNWGFIPWTEAEMAHAAKMMRLLIDKRLVWFAEIDGVPAAVALALPNVNEALHDLHGELLPFGWLKLLWRLKVRGVKTARVPLTGVKRAFAGTLAGMALPFIVIDALRAAGMRLGYRSVELSWILEDNQPMRRIAEALGARQYKTYRLFDKALT